MTDFTRIAPDVVVCPELALLIDAARAAAWSTHCNVVGIAYLERKEAVARLRGALQAYDARREEIPAAFNRIPTDERAA